MWLLFVSMQQFIRPTVPTSIIHTCLMLGMSSWLRGVHLIRIPRQRRRYFAFISTHTRTRPHVFSTIFHFLFIYIYFYNISPVHIAESNAQARQTLPSPPRAHSPTLSHFQHQHWPSLHSSPSPLPLSLLPLSISPSPVPMPHSSVGDKYAFPSGRPSYLFTSEFIPAISRLETVVGHLQSAHKSVHHVISQIQITVAMNVHLEEENSDEEITQLRGLQVGVLKTDFQSSHM